MNLLETLERVADAAIESQHADGSFPPGQNGPHGDPETPVRTTSHYLVMLTKLYEETGEGRYREAASDAASYLARSDARPGGYTFVHRTGADDRCNGTIGQAWTIEAIAEAGRVLDVPALVDVAEEVFLLHPFDDTLGHWKRVEVDGEVICLESTYNHQLWFAAAGGLLATYHDVNPEIDRQVRRFLDRSARTIGQRDDGLFELLSRPPYRLYPYVGQVDPGARMLLALLAQNFPLLDNQRVRDLTRRYTPFSRLPVTSDEYYHRLVGYQSFHLYGLALLREVYPDHDLWDCGFVSDGLALTRTDRFVDELHGNTYGYPYNVSGVELAYALDVFCEDATQAQQTWIGRQFDRCWDDRRGRMARNNPDPETLTARLYEVARLSDLDIRVPTEVGAVARR